MAVTSIILNLVLLSITYSEGAKWTYKGPDGETNWSKNYPYCGGVFQSPIDFEPELLRYDHSLTQIELLHYNLSDKELLTLVNNGHSVQLSLPSRMSLSGLSHRYSAAQLHLHWGSQSLPAGSEHTINGKRFPAEMHVVHFNSDKYPNVSVAADRADGLAVLGVLIEVGRFNPAFDRFLTYIDGIKYKNQTVKIPAFNIRELLPDQLDEFYRYDGSLTTPPCYPSVLWTVFRTPISISHTQFLGLATTVYSSTVGDDSPVTLSGNYRRTQNPGDRTVLVNFQEGDGMQGVDTATSPLRRRQAIQKLLASSLAKATHKEAPQIQPRISHTLDSSKKWENWENKHILGQSTLKENLPKLKAGSLLLKLWNSRITGLSEESLCYSTVEKRTMLELKKAHLKNRLAEALREVVFPALNLGSYLNGRSELSPFTVRHLLHSQRKHELEKLQNSLVKPAQVPSGNHESEELQSKTRHPVQ
ncbi:carbonic anhydrase 12 isoform X1 [Paramormyrops kingsleyae]|nr:carbonic anhydrase 12 isoform X1 [Paramormyrops kingsleyae]